MGLARAEPAGVVGAELGEGAVGGTAVGDDLVAAGVVGLGVDASAVAALVRAHEHSSTLDRRVLSCLTEAHDRYGRVAGPRRSRPAGRCGAGPQLKVAPTTTSPTGQPSNAARILARRQTALAWCGGLAWAGCLCCQLCSSGQNRVAAIAHDPGVSLLDLQATQRHQRLSELSQAGDRFLERSDWLASCPPWWRTYRGHHCMALTRIGPKRGLRSPDTSVCSRADTRKERPKGKSSSACSRHEGIHDVAPLRQPDRARRWPNQPL